MRTKSIYLFLTVSLLVFLSSCLKAEFEANQGNSVLSDDEQVEAEITNLVIPKDFDFATQQSINILINDTSPYVRYDVYAYNESPQETKEVIYQNEIGETVTDTEEVTDMLNRLLFTAVPYNGIIEQQIVLPAYYSQVYIRRKEQNVYSSEIVSVINDRIDYTYSGTSGKTSKAGVTDLLYCVTGNRELFQIDPLDGAYTAISTIPEGSYAAAIDLENEFLYCLSIEHPYPLMRYDIIKDKWKTVRKLKYGGSRLGFNQDEGLLYFANNNYIKKIDPIKGKTLSTWYIFGLHNYSGGDLAFDTNGVMYMCTYSGVYKLELTNDSYYQATRISADNLPFNPTSMTFDSNNTLWLASGDTDADLITMDTETGSWEYRYGVHSEGNSSIGHSIHDLTTFKVYSEIQTDPDTDGDGIIDTDDDYPEDAEKAFEIFAPSQYGFGTLAFEDLWPFQGDYDFNDLTVKYRTIAIQNAQNKVVKLDIKITSISNGAGLVNAFGMEFKNLQSSKVESITGTVLTQNYINLNANGTEANQENTVVIFYDNNYAVLNQDLEISIKFKSPVDPSDLGTAPFNPFIIVGEDRSVEVHLPYESPTSLADNNVVPEGNNKDIDKNYVTDTGLPWAINVVNEFKVPKEKIAINKAYNHFFTWAESGGNVNADWYKDSSGYRNKSLLVDD